MHATILSRDGEGVGLACRLTEEGHKVLFHVPGRQLGQIGAGFFESTQDVRPLISKTDIVICATPGFGFLEDTLKKSGKPLFGCSFVAEQLNEDVVKQYELFSRLGIPTPVTKITTDFGKLYEIAIHNSQPYMVKFGNRTFNCSRQEWLSWAITQIPPGASVIIQDLVLGSRFYIEGWWNGRTWLSPFLITFPEKNGGVIRSEGSTKKFSEYTLSKLDPFFKATSYRGPVRILCALESGNLMALSIKIGLKFPCSYAIFENVRENIFDLFYDTAMSTRSTLVDSDDYAMAVNLDSANIVQGSQIIGISPDNINHLYFNDVFLLGTSYFTCGNPGKVLTATAHGRTLSECRRRIARTLDVVDVVEKSYNAGVGSLVPMEMSKMLQWSAF